MVTITDVRDNQKAPTENNKSQHRFRVKSECFSIDAGNGFKKPRMKFDEIMLRASTNMIDCDMEVDTSTDLETMASRRFSSMLLIPFLQHDEFSRFSVVDDFFRFSSTSEVLGSNISDSVHETTKVEAMRLMKAQIGGLFFCSYCSNSLSLP
jgi:hypothetical protein